MTKSQKGNFLPIVGVVIVIILIGLSSYYLGKLNNTHQSVKDKPVSTPNPLSQNDPNSLPVRIVDGDIVVNNDGVDKKITEWGYNFTPVLSPDGKKIAYISKTKESFENIKKHQGYVPSSTNLWIINRDGTNPIQATDHEDWIFRDNLLWLDDNRLLYTDGTSSVRVYSLDNKKNITVLGPEKPEPVCVDACGGGTKFIFSPDNKYLLLLADGRGGAMVLPPSSILDINSLNSVDINQEFTTIDYSSLKFSNNKTVSFSASTENSEKMKEVTVDLTSGKSSF